MNLEDYLKTNISNQKEIANTTSFYSKFNELSKLYGQQENTDGRKILRSQGKYNSKICLIFKDEEHFKNCIKSLEKIFSVYDVKFWDVLVLYKNKFDQEDRNISVIIDELLIVNPMVVYIFDNTKLEKELLNNCPKDTILGFKTINVNNIQNIVEDNVSSKIFDLFEYLITYNY
jgi:hypothetical protein